MEFILSLIAHGLRLIWPVVILLIIFLYSWIRYGRKLLSPNKVLIIALVAVVMTVILIFMRNFILAPIINHYGIPAEGKVISRSPAMFSDPAYNPQYRYKAIFNKSNGETQEVSYWTGSKNAYPHADAFSAKPAGPGSSFSLKYLPMFPSSFIFVVNSPTESAACLKLKRELQEFKIRLEFDADNLALQKSLEALQNKFDSNCRPTSNL